MDTLPLIRRRRNKQTRRWCSTDIQHHPSLQKTRTLAHSKRRRLSLQRQPPKHHSRRLVTNTTIRMHPNRGSTGRFEIKPVSLSANRTCTLPQRLHGQANLVNCASDRRDLASMQPDPPVRPWGIATLVLFLISVYD